MFCMRSYSCVPELSNCPKQPNKWAKKCSLDAGQIYSFSKQACIYRANGTIVPQDFITTWSALDMISFMLVHETSVSVNTGQNYISSDDMFSLSAGDVIALRQETGVLHYEEMSSACHEFSVTNGPTTLNTQVSASSMTGTCHTSGHKLQAHIVQPSCLTFIHNYSNGLRVYNMTVNVGNEVSSSSDFALVDVQEVIESVRFNCSDIGKCSSHVVCFFSIVNFIKFSKHYKMKIL